MISSSKKLALLLFSSKEIAELTGLNLNDLKTIWGGWLEHPNHKLSLSKLASSRVPNKIPKNQLEVVTQTTSFFLKALTINL